MLSVARVWRARECIEREAATLFAMVADNLQACGEPQALVDMARTAAEDELDHAERCRSIVQRFAPNQLPPLEPRPAQRLGPSTLSARDRALYETVAVGCITESLSCGLLMAMRQRAEDELVAETIQHILKDEVQHSRLGWAHIAHAAKARDISWLAPHVAPMLRTALRSDVVPMCTDVRAPGSGVLTHEESRIVVGETIRKVILPGLAMHGITPDITQLVD